MIKKILYDFIESLIRNISGTIGRKIRYIYYKNRFAYCGKNIYIDEGVIFENPENIYLYNDIWIDKYSILIAGKKNNFLKIGSFSHIGIRTIIQAQAGVEISEYFTSSADSKIYSVSNDYKKTRSGAMKNSYYITSTIKIGKNVWLGLNSIILKGIIKDDVFIAPNSVVLGNIEKNSFVSGNPAMKIKNRFDIEDTN